MSQSTNPPRRSGTPGATPGPADVEDLAARARESAGEITAQAKESALGAVDDAIAGVKDQASALLDRASEALGDVRGAAHEALGGDAATGEAARGAHVAGGGARLGLVETIKVNPFPAVLVGLGLGWIVGQSRGTGVRASRDSRAGEAAYREHRPAPPTPPSAYGAYAGGGNLPAGRNPVGAPLERMQMAAGNAIGQAGDLAGQAGSAIGDTVGQVGEAASHFVGQVGEAGSAIGDTVGQVGEAASHFVGQVGETASNVASGTAQTAGNIAEQAQYQAMRLENTFQRTLRENPLAVGAMALAVGAAVGLALPQTARENQLMGEARDTLLERAQEFAGETVEKVQAVATEAQQTATETVKDEAQKQGLAR